MTENSVLAQLNRVRAVPVLRSATADQAVHVATALAAGGLTVIELTFSTPDVTDAISRLSARGDVVVGAGTVLTRDHARAAVDAGAQFLVSPLWLPWLPELASELGVIAIPGAATPTEIWQAHESGVPAVKVFPIARLGGASYIRDLLAPLPQLTLMATGGADLQMARELLDAGCVAVGLGSIHKDDRLGSTIEDRARHVHTTLTRI